MFGGRGNLDSLGRMLEPLARASRKPQCNLKVAEPRCRMLHNFAMIQMITLCDQGLRRGFTCAERESESDAFNRRPGIPQPPYILQYMPLAWEETMCCATHYAERISSRVDQRQGPYPGVGRHCRSGLSLTSLRRQMCKRQREHTHMVGQAFDNGSTDPSCVTPTHRRCVETEPPKNFRSVSGETLVGDTTEYRLLSNRKKHGTRWCTPPGSGE